MNKAVIISATKTVDGAGCMQHSLDIEAAIIALGIDIHHLYIEPLSADWNAEPQPDHFKSGCAPVEALARAKSLIEQGTSIPKAVIITGHDDLKTGYHRDERLRLMSVYADDYPLTQAYTDLAKQFIRHHDIDEDLFRAISKSLFDNHKTSYRNALCDDFSPAMLPDERWYQPLTELFRGVDCANPLVDFSGRVLLCNEVLAEQLNIPQNEQVNVSAVGVSKLEGDGPEHIDQIADYQHLKAAYLDCCKQAGIDFAARFRKGEALLETYTCYPVVPMAFLLVSGLVDMLEDIPEFLKQHSITITGGMNLARAPWNNPALNGIIDMVKRLIDGDEEIGLIHANGGLGYRQGVALLGRCG
ncbi:MAG: hypothetical protein HRT35_09415 [Algicola sp.]|nr:hypothetical protein [Algicola sp.]